jgi:glutaredoxin
MAARNDLVARGVEYEEIDVTVTPGAQDRLAELTLGTMLVPVIVEEDGEVRIAAGGG